MHKFTGYLTILSVTFLLSLSSIAVELPTYSCVDVPEVFPTRMVNGPDGKLTQVRDYTNLRMRPILNGILQIEARRNFAPGRTDICEIRIHHKDYMSWDRASKIDDDRSIAFDTRGDLSIAMSGHDNKPDSHLVDDVTTCDYRILPAANSKPGPLDTTPGGTGQILDGSGLQWQLDSTNGGFASTSPNGCDYEYETVANRNNNCGFRLKSCPNRVVIDFGLNKLDNSSVEANRSKPEFKATVRHPSGKFCKVKNKHLLEYVPIQASSEYPPCTATRTDRCTEVKGGGKVTYDERPMNKTPLEIKAALDKYCRFDGSKKLDWSFLENQELYQVAPAGTIATGTN